MKKIYTPLNAHTKYKGTLKAYYVHHIIQSAFNLEQDTDKSFCNVPIIFSIDSDTWLEIDIPCSNKIWIHEIDGKSITDTQAWQISCTPQELNILNKTNKLLFTLDGITFEISDINPVKY